MSERFPMTATETTNVRRMADIVALFYLRPFLQSRLASMIPAVDLEYLSLMSMYKEVDEKLRWLRLTL